MVAAALELLSAKLSLLLLNEKDKDFALIDCSDSALLITWTRPIDRCNMYVPSSVPGRWPRQATPSSDAILSVVSLRCLLLSSLEARLPQSSPPAPDQVGHVVFKTLGLVDCSLPHCTRPGGSRAPGCSDTRGGDSPLRAITHGVINRCIIIPSSFHRLFLRTIRLAI
jgi:hypothetical protein